MTHDQGEIGLDMPTTTTEDSATEGPVALLPIGSFEQHGPHLPLVTDTLIAIADSISRQHNVFQLPPLAFGCSHEHSDFPGTVSIGATTLNSIVADLIDSLISQGTRSLVVVNAHGGNYVLSNAVQTANTKGDLHVGLFPSREDWTEAREAAGITTTNHDDMHAGELETSILLASIPDTSATDGRPPTTARPTAGISQPSACARTPTAASSATPREPAPRRAVRSSIISARRRAN